jgi:hypothetical protein
MRRDAKVVGKRVDQTRASNQLTSLDPRDFAPAKAFYQT